MPQIKMPVYVLFFAVFCVSALAQNLPETHAKIRRAFENRDFAAAASELENLKKTDAKLFELNNYDYLLARVSEKNGDFAAAAANYQAVVNRRSVLTEYALWHLSQTARATGNLLLERIYMQQFFVFAAPDSLPNEAANERLARSYFESKDFGAATAILQSQSQVSVGQTSGVQTGNSENQKPKAENPESADRNPKKRENSALLAQAYLQSGRATEARAIFTNLLSDLPNAAQPDDFALTAAKALDEIDGGGAAAGENFAESAPQIAADEHLRRAFAYQFNRNFARARLHYRAIVERYPQSASVADALFQIGRGYAQEGNFNEAVNWFERVQAEFAQNPISKDALSQTASAYARALKPKVAVARYQTFIEKYADADNVERAYLNIVDVLRDQGEEANALKYAAKTREVFRGKAPEEAVAVFAQARIHIARDDWQSALNDLNDLQNFADLGGARVPGGTNRAEVAFLKGFALEKLNRFGEAADVYLSIPDGRAEYYGWRATERLKSLARGEKSNQIVLQKLNQLRYVLSQPLSNANAENQRQTAQSALRLTADARIENQLLETIKKTYALLPNYRKIPNGKLLDFGRAEVLREKRAVKNKNHHRILADEFLFLGLYDEGAPELEAAEIKRAGKGKNETVSPPEVQSQNVEHNTTSPKSKVENPTSEDFAYTLAVFYNRGEMANRAVAYAEPLWRNVPADYQIELVPRDQIELLYPAPYADALLKYAPQKNVDARFLLSIMRQESRFRPDVKSVAAARGLMQFISTSSEKIAVELGRENFKQNDLYNPPTAILFGAQYLADLFKQFPAAPQAVAASYNGGEDNVARWLARANAGATDADRYTPEIVFTQSKDYVYKVLANYRVYRMFYDEKLK